ncbi:LGFP repeat-containing protein [Gordonia sp. DT30]|uniref:LGFP repeat-containing protein n=1 Tax=unclassified Gordonia (in: high G+C Gram-positive bacteria) TaxID=2657482 RepID=UPI003CEF28A4
MKQTMRLAVGVAAISVAVFTAAGCSDDNNDSSASSSSSATMAESPASNSAGAQGQSVSLTAADGTPVTLTGPIAAKYNSATEKQKTDLGKPKTGAEASGTSPNGVVFQQFDGGVITAKNADAPAYITWGKIRDAWNLPRDASGQPAPNGKGGSQGPLGTATSDETEAGTVKTSTFEHGKITWDSATDKVEVTVNGTVVPAS